MTFKAKAKSTETIQEEFENLIACEYNKTKDSDGHYLLCRPATLAVLLAVKAVPNQTTRIYADATNTGRTTSMILAWLRDMGFIDQAYAEKKNPGSHAVLSSLRHSFEEIPLNRIAVLNS